MLLKKGAWRTLLSGPTYTPEGGEGRPPLPSSSVHLRVRSKKEVMTTLCDCIFSLRRVP